MTTGPRGEKMTYDQRLAEILTRYDQNSIVGRAMLRAEPTIRGHQPHPTADRGIRVGSALLTWAWRVATGLLQWPTFGAGCG